MKVTHTSRKGFDYDAVNDSPYFRDTPLRPPSEVTEDPVTAAGLGGMEGFIYRNPKTTLVLGAAASLGLTFIIANVMFPKG